MSGTTLTAFTPGDLVISVYGAANGSGTYTLNQASAITLEELTPAGALVGSLVLPQTTTVVNGTTEYAISGEYGSSSEGILQLSADGRSVAILGYGVNAAAFNAAGASGTSVYGNTALAQSTSVAGGAYTPVARIVADIGANAAIDTSTSLFNIYDTNNPRSVATLNGSTFYLSGQGVKGGPTQGVFLATDGSSAATAIDTSTDTRTAEIYNGQLFVSRDSTQGAAGQGATGTSDLASYGGLPTTAATSTVLPGIAGQVTLAAGQTNSVNASAVGTSVNLSPESYFFANATTLYIADSGFPKQGGIGDGGLQKWSLVGGRWTLDYTLSQGLNQVADTASAGTTGLLGLTGTVVGGTVQLYATTATAGETNQSYLYGITDTLGATTLPATESFTQLMAALPDSTIRGVSFAPTAAVAAPVNTNVSSGQTSAGIVVSSGSNLTVQAGGAVTGATTLSGGTAVVSGTGSGGIVAHGGVVTVAGSVSGDQVAGTETAGAASAVISNAVVENGGAVSLLVDGAGAVGTLVTTGGVLNISAAAAASNTTISGGAVVLQTGTSTLAGTAVFAGGGLLQQTAVTGAGFGDQAVISGFGTGDVIDLSAVNASGATLAKTVSGTTTTATVTSGGVSQSFLFAGSVAASLGLGTDPNGAAEIVFVPPLPTNVTVSSGITSTGLRVTSGSTLTVNAGGVSISTTILSGGTATIAGTDSGTVISAGGTELLLGSANADQVYGVQNISSVTALATNETVFNGGVVNDLLKSAVLTGMTISSGGTLNISGNTTASNTTIASGGLVNLQSPKANLTGTLTFAGGGTLVETAVISAGSGDLAVIRNFTSGAVVDITTIAPGTATLTSTMSGGNTVLTVSGGGTSQPFTFAGTYAPGYFVLGADSGSGTQITTNVPCYCRGTRVLTVSGEVAVEDLAIGDRLVTASGAERPITWIGRRSYGGRFTRGNREVLPIRIQAGALADGVPARDLFVSPLHAMFLDGLLIPARFLVNGGSVTQVARMDLVEYFHVELDTHDVILAEGAAAESFVDDDSRAMFHNAADYAGTAPVPAIYCAERVEDGPLLEPIWQRIAARARNAEAA